MDQQYRIEPVTPGRAGDLAAFAVAHGKFGYCSCLRWRLRSGPFGQLTRAERTDTLTALVREEQPVGVLAYDGDEPVGWCSIAPRETYAAIMASRVIPQLPGAGVWSVTCFFLVSRVRRRGLLPPLLEGACGYAARSGALTAESYPWPGGASYRFMGTRELYLAAGFREMTVPPGCRPVMRRELVTA